MSKFNFKRVIDNIEQVKRDLPRLLANDAQNYFLGAFNNQGWDGKSWAEVQRREPDTNAYKYPKDKGLSRRTKNIGISTGRMRREVSNIAGKASISTTQNNFTVRLRVDSGIVPYAGYFNDGTSKMVARPFMKDSPALRRILINRVKTYMDRTWKA